MPLVAYNDRIIPLAVEAIQQREDPAIKLYNSVEISNVPIEVSADTPVTGTLTFETAWPITVPTELVA